MDTAVKKIIAREFLVLISVILIGAISYFGIFLRNEYLKFRKSDAISLSQAYDNKMSRQYWLIEKENEWTKRHPFDKKRKSKEWKELIQFSQGKISFKNLIISNELINFLKYYGFGSPGKFQVFYNESKLNSSEIDDYNKSQKLLIDLEKDNSKFIDEEDQNRLTQLSTCIAFIVLFILRYIFYSIRWSINTLKL